MAAPGCCAWVADVTIAFNFSGKRAGEAAVGTAVRATVASSNTANTYSAGVAAGAAAAAPTGATFAALPYGCTYTPSGGRPHYYCPGGGGYRLKPYYGANGVYYEDVGTP
jgi:hypothetical protein